MTDLPPCVNFEDEHLLVVNKPPGWNTHAPAPYAGEGIYDWLRAREDRWAKLAIVHRLDKETSGLIVFTKTPEANRSLTEQFTRREVKKEYVLLTEAKPDWQRKVVRSKLRRVGEKYLSGDLGDEAETEFELLGAWEGAATAVMILARPKTGRTHQIRVHAADAGAPIIGDPLYNPTARSRRESVLECARSAPLFPARLCLHARSISFRHPASGQSISFETPDDFAADPRRALRASIIASDTDSLRWIHQTDWAVEKLGPYIYSQAPADLSPSQTHILKDLSGIGAYHKLTTNKVRGTDKDAASPKHLWGEHETDITIRENGVRFGLSFTEGYSTGLFLDQRDNRRRVLKADWNGKEVLNTFAYTCGFSVCAGLAGARATSLDLSKKYLEWGKRNFALNGIDPAAHDFIYGDVFDWLKRFAKKGRLFDLVLLDPPTFSQAKESGVFQAEKDYGKLVALALKVLRPGGTLFASSNAAKWEPEAFMQTVRWAIAAEGRKIVSEKYFPQPPDFPISRDTPAYLKTAWFKIE